MNFTATLVAGLLTIVIQSAGAQVATRYYEIPPDRVPGQFSHESESNYAARVNHTRAILRSTPEAIRKLFRENDVALSTNSVVHYSESSALLSLTTSEDTHDAVRKMFRRLEIVSSAIRVDFAHIVFKRSDIERLALGTSAAVPLPSDILTLWRAKKGRSEISSSFYVNSGVNAQLQSVQEIPYPAEEYDKVIPLQKPSTNTFMCGPPIQFETRQVGWIINITATVRENLDEIDVTTVPEVTWPLDDNWKSVKTFTRPPIFSSRQISTSLRVRSGVPWVSGGFRELPTDDISYFIMTCTVDEGAD